MCFIASTADHYMSLVRIPVYRLVLRNIKLRFDSVPFSYGGRNVTDCFLQQSDHSFEINIPLYKENHLVGTVVPICETEGIFAFELTQQFRFSQDVSTQWVVWKNQFFKVIENQFRRSVLITLDFVDDDFHFLVYFRLGVCAVKNDVGKQFYRSRKMFHQECAVHHRFFLVGVSVQVSPYMLHTVQNVPGMTLLCSFENKMFYKVSHSLFVFGFIAGAGINCITAISNSRLVLGMDDS